MFKTTIMTENLNKIENKLRAFVERKKRRDGLNRLLLFILVLSLGFLSLIILEAVGNNSSEFRTVLFWLSLTGITAGLIFFVALPFIKDIIYYSRPDFIEVSKTVGAHFPEIKDELANAVQIINERNSHYSDKLVDAAFKNVYEKSEKLDFKSLVQFSSTKRLFRICLIVLTASIITVSITPGLDSAVHRLINFGTNFSPPPKFLFSVIPGNLEISKGDNVKIIIKTEAEQQSEIFLSTKSEEQSEHIVKKLSPDSLGNFNYEEFSVKSSFEYFASAGKIKSESYMISVVNRPAITGFEITISPPAYSQMPDQIQKDNGNISAMPGSILKIALNSSRELSKAVISFSDNTRKNMSVSSAKSSIIFPVFKEANYQILIEDKQGFVNLNPITYSIKLLTDASPSIEMLSPDQNIKLANETKISLVSKISDDYGFSRMNLNYRLSASKYRQITDEFTKIPITISNQLKEDEIYFVWDLGQLVLAEGEVIAYYLEVFDNDIVNGPKPARTPQFTIAVPSMDALFADADIKQEDASKELTEILKEAGHLKQEMQKISDDLKQNSKDISWQEKEKVEKAAEKFKDIGKKIDEISEKLSEMKNDLAKNNLLSEETLKKYNELQELLEKMSTDEMKDAFKRLQEALKSLNRDNVQMSMEEMKANEEYIRKSIERTLNLLKRVQIEQKVDELLKRTEELTEKIDDLKNKTEQSNLSDKPKRDELANRQKDISQDLKSLSEEMNKLDVKMDGMNDMPQDQLDNIRKDLEKQNNENISDEAAKDIQQQQKQGAMQNQQQLSQNMKNLGKQMKSMQSGMQQMNQMNTFLDMMKILDDLLTLSKDQEKLKNDTEQLSPYSNEFSNNLREQSKLQSNLGKVLQKMGDLSQKTFAITPEMGKSLGQALSDMQQSMNAMMSNQGPPATQMQKSAMSSLNNAAGMMKSAMDQLMSGGGSGGGMMSMMQQLQQLGQQQMGLNQLTQMMNNGQMSQEMMAQTQRLAQQQEAIRKSLEQLNREAKESGQSKRIAGNLEKILSEMREVVSNLQSQKLDNDIVKQQERILTKLLDAQRSMNERDYEKDRKSESGKDFTRTSPPDLILNTDEGKNKLKDELLKAVREGYKKDYEDLIRKYFELLQKKTKK
ncbi:MAG: hypothetical protein CVV24_00360 [Ignavibacteriae bacterium HGW-Ignavibacteriae-3]|nr:MAG: hypothetical protein CVV24_00360 [Ignavibacteriae bacterium HGW-Ignavibacteriae-3]